MLHFNITVSVYVAIHNNKLTRRSYKTISAVDTSAYLLIITRICASLVAQLVKNSPAMWEAWVQSLGWKDPLEKEGKIPTPVLLPGKFHGQRSLVGPSPWGRKESATSERLHCPSMPGDQVQLFFLGRAFIPLLPTRVPGLLHQQKLIRDQTSNSGIGQPQTSSKR